VFSATVEIPACAGMTAELHTSATVEIPACAGMTAELHTVGPGSSACSPG
jgi:hypothetical protein